MPEEDEKPKLTQETENNNNTDNTPVRIEERNLDRGNTNNFIDNKGAGSVEILTKDKQ